jgi:hypothetical protein
MLLLIYGDNGGRDGIAGITGSGTAVNADETYEYTKMITFFNT